MLVTKIYKRLQIQGVGSYIIQLAKHYKIKTYNIVRRKELINKLKKELGADKVILDNKKYKEIKKLNVKLFIDAMGGHKVNNWAENIQIMELS